MGQRNCLNERRLTPKQVQDLIAGQGQLHEEYTLFFTEMRPDGRMDEHWVYELPDHRFLFVFGQQDSLAGRGDMYAEDYFLRWMSWVRRVRADYAANRASSVDHWRFYSRYKDQLMEHIPELKNELAQALNLEIKVLDDSYASLSVVSAACESYGLENVFADLYDNVVAYVGEVIRKRVRGYWQLNAADSGWSGGAYPFISVGQAKVQYMVVNVVWCALSGLGSVDFRKEAANEVRRQALRK